MSNKKVPVEYVSKEEYEEEMEYQRKVAQIAKKNGPGLVPVKRNLKIREEQEKQMHQDLGGEENIKIIDDLVYRSGSLKAKAKRGKPRKNGPSNDWEMEEDVYFDTPPKESIKMKMLSEEKYGNLQQELEELRNLKELQKEVEELRKLKEQLPIIRQQLDSALLPKEEVLNKVLQEKKQKGVVFITPTVCFSYCDFEVEKQDDRIIAKCSTDTDFCFFIAPGVKLVIVDFGNGACEKYFVQFNGITLTLGENRVYVFDPKEDFYNEPRTINTDAIKGQ